MPRKKLDYAGPARPEPVPRVWRVLAGVVLWVLMLLILAAHAFATFTRF